MKISTVKETIKKIQETGNKEEKVEVEEKEKEGNTGRKRGERGKMKKKEIELRRGEVSIRKFLIERKTEGKINDNRRKEGKESNMILQEGKKEEGTGTPKRKRGNNIEDELKENETPSKRKRLFNNWRIFEEEKEENRMERKLSFDKKKTTERIRKLTDIYERKIDKQVKIGIEGKEKENVGQEKKKKEEKVEFFTERRYPWRI